MADMNRDTRHMSKVRDAADRTISEPGNTVATSPPAKQRVEILTPARHADRTTSPRSAMSRR